LKEPKKFNVEQPVFSRSESLNLVIDSTGLKVFGEGEKKVRADGEGTKVLVVTDGTDVPLAVEHDSAAPAESKLALQTLKKICGKRPRRGHPGTMKQIKRLIGKKAMTAISSEWRL
jgi:hypothetical protein